MEKIVAQARVYYIVGYGRDTSVYDDKKWVLGKVYLSDKRMIFKKLDRYTVVNYHDIIAVEERDKYFRVSPPMGWSRGSILELQHYEDESRRHVLTSLISADFDVITKLKAIIAKFALDETKKIELKHKKILILLSLGIKDGQISRFLLDLTPESYESAIQELKLAGLISENKELTAEGRKTVFELKKRI